jgi:hypothetical protein
MSAPNQRAPMAGASSAGGALARSLRAMTLGTLKSYNDRRDSFEADTIGEIDQQYQVTIAGEAGPQVVWNELVVAFDAPFIDGREDRNAPFQYPMFTYGTVVLQGSRLVVVCNVIKWNVLEDYVRGCTLEIGVFRPQGGGVGDYRGELHLNFEGWGAPNAGETDAESEVGDDRNFGAGV